MVGRLAGKRCLIVGGTSGIGLASAELFLREGARVVIAGLEAAEGERAAARLGQECSFQQCDATQGDQVGKLQQMTVERLGGLDVLFHVAGASGRRHGDGALHECSEEGWSWTIATNLTSTFLTNAAAVRHFLGVQQPGVVLNMASALALAPGPRYFDTCAYTASKGGVIALTQQAAARYAQAGIRVNALAPGLIDTPMAQRAVRNPVIQDYVRTRQPLSDGPGSANDCAAAAVYLCSDEARMLTGVVLPVDGGWRLDTAISG